MKPATLTLTVCAGAVRNATRANPIDNQEVQRMLQLFDGTDVECRVYSSTNICFDVTETMLRNAYERLDKEKHGYWIPESCIEGLVKRYTKPYYADGTGTLAMCLPNLHCGQTPAEIQVMLDKVGA